MASLSRLVVAAALLCVLAGAASAQQIIQPSWPCTRTTCLACASRTRCWLCRAGYWKDALWRCRRCPATCTRCRNVNNRPYCTACRPGYLRVSGKCIRRLVIPCPSPTWDMGAFTWVRVYGRADNGACIKCTPTGNHAGWCKACDGDKPAICTLCKDPNNGFPMYIDANGECQFCTAIHDGCLACANGTGFCLRCDESKGYKQDGAGSCIQAV